MLRSLLFFALLQSAHAAGVRVEICEQGLNDKDEWPKESPKASESFTAPAFGLDQLPAKFEGEGLRAARPSPSLLRMKASVSLPVGTHQVLLRSRSAARLFVDGAMVHEIPFAPKSAGDGSQDFSKWEEPIDLGEGYRFAPGGEIEKLADITLTTPTQDIMLEAFIGGREGGKSPRRVELGETVVAVKLAGTQAWQVLSPTANMLPYTDAAWESYHTQLTNLIAKNEAKTRAAGRAKNHAIWDKRRAAADAWLKSTPETPVPALAAGFTASNAIDHFIAQRFTQVKAQNSATGGVDFFGKVKPLLEARCMDCHRGAKAKGDLRMDSLSAMLKGGESGPAFVKHKPADSEMMKRVQSTDDDEVMPPKGARLTKDETALLAAWIKEGAPWPELPLVRQDFTGLADDMTFLRRVYLDTVGVPPTSTKLTAFVNEASASKREQVIDKLLKDQRWADQWMPLWQDLLAENPNILNPTLNNTGPFRRWLHDVLVDDVPVDRMITQLLLQGGDEHAGGPAAFGLASQNDSPFAAKGTIVSAALLGIETKCARCHDSPNGSSKQEQLFQLGAMLAAKELDVPKTSSVDPDKLHANGRKALIEVTLKPGTKVKPAWPFPDLVDYDSTATLTGRPDAPRNRLAAAVTAPQNERFAQVIVNRLWQRLMGRGIVEPLDNWEKGQPTHPELLRWLGRELVRSGYQMKHVARLILTSQAYQRATDATLRSADPLYAAPEPRRLLAEQVVDSLFASTGKPMKLDRVCLDLNGRRDQKNSTDLGLVTRAWMLTSLSNERDRPSLNIPRLQAVVDVLSALGWRGARQDPVSVRDIAPNALQPAILANGTMSGWLTRLSADHPLTDFAVKSASAETLVNELYLRLLSRKPTSPELALHGEHLSVGFKERLTGKDEPTPLHRAPRFVTWSNHLMTQANTAITEREAESRAGDPPTARLSTAWRQRCEDVIWALINSPEMLHRP